MGTKTFPPFYVITVNYHGGAYLKDLIDSLKPLSFIDKLLIINHSPEEKLLDLQAPFPLQVINQKNMGYGAGLNRGLREITEENSLALLCNPDVTLLTPVELEMASRYLVNHPQVGCLIPQSVDEDLKPLYPVRTFYSLKTLLASRVRIFSRTLPKFYREHFYMDTPGRMPRPVDWGCGAAMLYRVSAFGGRPAFDEGFFLYLEDVDLCVRLWQEGLSVVSYPDLVFQHQVQRKSHINWRFFLYHIASLIRFVRKYRGFPQRQDLSKALKDRRP